MKFKTWSPWLNFSSRDGGASRSNWLFVTQRLWTWARPLYFTRKCSSVVHPRMKTTEHTIDVRQHTMKHKQLAFDGNKQKSSNILKNNGKKHKELKNSSNWNLSLYSTISVKNLHFSGIPNWFYSLRHRIYTQLYLLLQTEVTMPNSKGSIYQRRFKTRKMVASIAFFSIAESVFFFKAEFVKLSDILWRYRLWWSAIHLSKWWRMENIYNRWMQQFL